MDSSLDITGELLDSTPIEKCSLNPRRKNSRRLLTGFIIYASEVRKTVVEKHPDQNFGYISRLVGDQWRALSSDVRFKYHQRALIHNRRMKEQAQRDGITLGSADSPLSNGLHKTPKLSKKKLAKLAKQEQRLQKSQQQQGLDQAADGQTSIDSNENSTSTTIQVNDTNEQIATNKQQQQQQQQQQQLSSQQYSKKVANVDSSTQTPPIRFIKPPPRKPLMYSDAFLKRLQELRKPPVEVAPLEGAL